MKTQSDKIMESIADWDETTEGKAFREAHDIRTPAQAHSPLPWQAAGTRGVRCSLGYVAEATSEANAAFIVRACNEYEQSCRDCEQFKTMYQDELTWYNDMKAHAQRLADALKALKSRCDFGLDQSPDHDGIENCKAIANAREALAQWEGGKQ